MLDIMRVKKGMVFYLEDDVDKYNASYQTNAGEEKKDRTIRGRRPWLVISDDKFNYELGTVEVVPLTGSDFNFITEISDNLYEIIRTPKGESYVLINQAKTVNCPELNGYQFTVNPEVVERICKKRAIYLGLFPNEISIKSNISENIKNKSEVHMVAEDLDVNNNKEEILSIIKMYDDNKVDEVLEWYPHLFKNLTQLDKKIAYWCRELNCREPLKIENELEFLAYYDMNGLNKTLKKYNIPRSSKQAIYSKIHEIRKKNPTSNLKEA